MNELCMIIKDMVKPNFLNIKTSIQTYDREALCCGVPCWRWVYHALHSADKWFINPFDYEEPHFLCGYRKQESMLMTEFSLADTVKEK